MTNENGDRPFKEPTLPTNRHTVPATPATENREAEATVDASDSTDNASPSSSSRSEEDSDPTTTVADGDDTPKVSTELEKEIPSSVATDNTPKEALPPGIPYSVPDWAGSCRAGYFLEVLKNGVIITQIDLVPRTTHVLGRLPACHVPMEHPSLSRFHAVLQHRAVAEPGKGVGWYLFDLDSTHGTWVNKIKVRPMEFHRLRVGHVMKFGGSSRLYVLQGPEEDREPESDISYSQHLAHREKVRAMAEEKRLMAEKAKLELQSQGCSWGLSDDVVEEEAEEVLEMAEEPSHEDMYIKDPKKALRAYFEREGYDQPEYEFLDAGFGKHHCRVELLPLQVTSSGRSTFAEAVISGGKKKEAVTACALEACRMLDRMGELVKAATSRAQRRMRDWEANEFYDSDEDTFLDRTGDIERKRARRMAQAGKFEEGTSTQVAAPKADTFESLTAEFAALGQQIREVEATLERSRKQLQGGEQPAASELDALDAYMEGIKAGALDRRSRMALKMRLTEMRRQSQVLRRRLQAAAPNLSVLSMRAAATAARNTTAAPPPAPSSDQTPDHKPDKAPDRIPEEEPKPECEEPKPECVEPKPECEEPADRLSEEKEQRSEVNPSSRFPKVATGRMRFSMRTTVPSRQPLPKSAFPLPDDTAAPMEEEEEEEDEKVTSNVPQIESEPVSEDPGNEAESSTSKIFPARPEREVIASVASEDPSKEEKRKRRKRQRPTAASAPKPTSDEEFPDDPDYVCWMPPADQTGDGTTALNSRFGY